MAVYEIKAELLFDQKSFISNEAVIIPPTFGKIEIEKVDGTDETLKLIGAVFQVINKDGDVVTELTTNKNGLAVSQPLLVGQYKLKSTSTSRVHAYERAN